MRLGVQNAQVQLSAKRLFSDFAFRIEELRGHVPAQRLTGF